MLVLRRELRLIITVKLLEESLSSYEVRLLAICLKELHGDLPSLVAGDELDNEFIRLVFLGSCPPKLDLAIVMKH